MKNLKPAFIVLFSMLLVSLILNMLLTCKKDSIVPKGQTLVTQMIDYKKIPIVEGTLNGHKALFILDTGASISILDITQLKAFDVEDKGISENYIVGYGGINSETHELSTIDLNIGNTSMVIPFEGRNITNIVETIRKFSHRKIVGIIGNNNISYKKLILNFKTGQITK